MYELTEDSEFLAMRRKFQVRNPWLFARLFALLGLAMAPMPGYSYELPGGTQRVSMSNNGTEANHESHNPSISTDGRYVVFASRASNLVPTATSGIRNIFVRDRQTGTTELISVGLTGVEGRGISQFAPAISADGRFVAFDSLAFDLVSEPTNGRVHVFLRDRENGTTERVSVSSSGVQGNNTSTLPSISADGRYVAFQSAASNLVADDTNDRVDVFVRDRATGTTERVSVASDGSEANQGDNPSTGEGSYDPSITADGRYVAFISFASNLVNNDTNGTFDVFVHDRATGTTERVSVGRDGAEGFGFSSAPSISADGRYVAFQSRATNLVPGDDNGVSTDDIFVHDRTTGITERVSVGPEGVEANDISEEPFISADGRYVAFLSWATNIAPGDSTNRAYIFVHDRITATTQRISVPANGAQTNEPPWPEPTSLWPSISGDGRYVSFESFASNLVPGDTNELSDAFVRDRGPSLGVGQLSGTVQPGEVSLSGWASFDGAVITSATDPEDDGETIASVRADDVEAELTGATLTYRPQDEDILVTLDLKSLHDPDQTTEVIDFLTLILLNTFFGGPGHPAGAGRLYGLEFDIGSMHYEARALYVGATGAPPAVPQFALYRCDAACIETARLTGGIGTTGAKAFISIPLAALGAPEGAVLSGVRAFTAVGEATPGAVLTLDELALPNATIPARQVTLGIAPIGTDVSDVVFDHPATLTNADFTAVVESSLLPAAPYSVWARACLGGVCGPAVSWTPMQLLGVASRKVHGNAGMFEVDLSLTGNSAIECRSGGAQGDYVVVFRFTNALTHVGGATVTSGTGSISNRAIGADAHEYIVGITGVANAQSISISLTNVTDAAGQFSSAVNALMRVLVGDTTGDGVVNSADIAQTKSQSGQAVSGTNFREDVTVDGNLNSADISLVKSKSGTALP